MKLDVEGAPFPHILLAINFNFPYYKQIPLLIEYYKPIFPNYMFCGPERHQHGTHDVVKIDQIKREYGYYGTQCLVEAIRRNPGFQGYLYINDDMIINWWNFVHLDPKNIWFPFSREQFGKYKMGTKLSAWWRRASCGKKCTDLYATMEKNQTFADLGIFQIYQENVNNERVCVNSLSDIVYIPARHTKNFVMISQLFYDHRLFLEDALPMTLFFLEDLSNISIIKGIYLQRKYGYGRWTFDTTTAWNDYHYDYFFLHPYKFTGNNRKKNSKEFKDRIEAVSKRILKERCLDVLVPRRNPIF